MPAFVPACRDLAGRKTSAGKNDELKELRQSEAVAPSHRLTTTPQEKPGCKNAKVLANGLCFTFANVQI